MKKLTKSNNDRIIAGVCGGLAEYSGVDSVIVRLITALLVLSGGTGVFLYILAAILMPEAKASDGNTYGSTDKKSPSGRPMHQAKTSDDEDKWSDF